MLPTLISIILSSSESNSRSDDSFNGWVICLHAELKYVMKLVVYKKV